VGEGGWGGEAEGRESQKAGGVLGVVKEKEVGMEEEGGVDDGRWDGVEGGKEENECGGVEAMEGVEAGRRRERGDEKRGGGEGGG